MAFDFPATPTLGQVYPAAPAAGVAQYSWSGAAWVAVGSTANFVNRSGDTMTGALTLSGAPTVNLHAATKQYVDSIPVPDISGKVDRSGDTMTGVLNTAASGAAGSLISGSAGSLSIWVDGANASDAFLTFYSPGVFACNFGLGSDQNLHFGGYSFGAGGSYQLWSTRDFSTVPITNARLAYAGDNQPGAMNEPFVGAVVTGASATITFRFRYLQFFTTSWFTVGYT